MKRRRYSPGKSIAVMESYSIIMFYKPCSLCMFKLLKILWKSTSKHLENPIKPKKKTNKSVAIVVAHNVTQK